MPSKAFIVDQTEAFVSITHQHAEMLKLALPAGNYALIARGQADCGEPIPVHCVIETTTTIVARGGVDLPGFPQSSLPVPPLFGVLSLAAADTVRVNCFLHELSPELDAHGRLFRLMVWSVDQIG